MNEDFDPRDFDLHGECESCEQDGMLAYINNSWQCDSCCKGGE